ncbi:MAG: inorganic phosphate transporter, partial [Thermoplasmata archaeon]|nr:inorganic phosphate transporter [Thermoplasmata archaeon]
VFRLITRTIFNKDDPVNSARRGSPILLFATFMVIFSSLFLKTPLAKEMGVSSNLLMALGLAAACSALASGLGYVLLVLPSIERMKQDLGEYDRVEALFRKLQIITSCYVAFAHGANDVANAIGPVAGVFQAIQSQSVVLQTDVPVYLLLMGGVGISIGVFTWGYRVMKTVGFKITALTNTRGFSVDFGAATTVLVASKMGLPVSTTHTVVGAVIGVGLARGLATVDLKVVKDIVVSWLITVPIAALTCVAIFLTFKYLFI